MIEFLLLTENKQLKKQVKMLYTSAFPANERMPFFILFNKAKKDKGDFYAITDKTGFIGLAYTITCNDVVYLFFLAVEKKMRGMGYGSGILEELKKIYSGKRIILNIEELNPDAANYEERLNRKAFYERNGFRLAGVKSKEWRVAYDLMVYGDSVTYDDYAQIIKNFTGNLAYKLFYRQL